MRLVTWNVNGVRAASQSEGWKGIWKDLEFDVLALQEVKAFPEQLDFFLKSPKGYQSFWHSAEKAGYSGVAIFSRTEPLSVKEGLGVPEIDREGRVLQIEFKKFTLINAYFPNSQRDHARLPYKLQFCEAMKNICLDLEKKGKNLLLCGDLNIAHKEIDLKNPKENKDNAGFLPQERAWMDEFVNLGFKDTFRMFNGDPLQYTWWSYRPGVRERNIGWRLDYFLSNGGFSDNIERTYHLPEVRGSDHCPVVTELKL